METPPLGCTKDDLDTPALCLDLDILSSNIQKISSLCRSRGVAWRPHAKGHKVPAICHQQLQAGALGVTCAKLSEAHVMAQHGVKDILVANLIAGPHKVKRLVEVRKIADPIVCIDHRDQVLPISQAMQQAGLKVRVLMEVDIGLHRVGVQPGEPSLELARFIVSQPGIELAGIMGYEGHLLTLSDLSEKRERIFAALGQLTATKALLESHGIACPIVSAAGTGSYQITTEVPGVTEVQAGGATYMDAFYRHKCQVADLEYAMTVLVTVVSRPTPERAIMDAGRKTMNIEIQTPEVLGRDDIRVVRLSAEHGQLELDPSAQGLKIGDRLEIVPGYGDLTTVLHDKFYGFRQGRLECVWPILGRGMLQ